MNAAFDYVHYFHPNNAEEQLCVECGGPSDSRYHARPTKARVQADQERRRSNAAGPHKTPKHPSRSERRTAIAKEQDNG